MNKTLIASLLLTTTFGALADSSNFNYVQMSYSKVGFDEVAKDLDGFDFKMNYKINDSFYVNWDNIEVNNSDIDMKMRNIGFGFHSNINKGLEGYTQLDWTRLKTSDANLNKKSDEDGYRFSLGIRSQSYENVDLKAAFEFLDVGDETTNVFVFEAAYSFTDGLSIYATHKKQTNSDFSQYGIGLRYDIN